MVAQPFGLPVFLAPQPKTMGAPESGAPPEAIFAVALLLDRPLLRNRILTLDGYSGWIWFCRETMRVCDLNVISLRKIDSSSSAQAGDAPCKWFGSDAKFRARKLDHWRPQAATYWLGAVS